MIIFGYLCIFIWFPVWLLHEISALFILLFLPLLWMIDFHHLQPGDQKLLHFMWFNNSVVSFYIYLGYSPYPHVETYKNDCLKKTQPSVSCVYVGVHFLPSSRALLLITIPTQPYPHSLLQRHQTLKSPPQRSSSAETWDPMAFAPSTASAKSSAPSECLRLRKVGWTF